MGARTSTQNSSVPHLLLLVIVALGIFHSVKGDCRNFDFEDGPGTLTKWKKTGNAFDDQPTYGDNVHIRDPDISTNVQGDWWIGTFENRPNSSSDGGYFQGDYPRGTLTSPKFLITGPNINFLFGGGCDVGKLRAELLVKGKVVRQTVADGCNDKMQRRRWDVRPFQNKIAQIRLVDGSKRGHVNFDDLRGDFTCFGVPNDDEGNNHRGDVRNDNDDNTDDNEDFTVTDEQQPPVETKTNEENSDDALMTGTGDEYNNMSNSSDAQNNTYEEEEDEYTAMGNSSDVVTSIYKEKGIQDTESTLGRTKSLSEANVKVSKAADGVADVSSETGANAKSVAVNDDLKNLTCKDYVAEINTGKAWDNDFLFTSNENYQATRREMEVKVLSAYEDDKDFRGAFFNKFSSFEEPDGVKAYFILKFRAYGKFLWRLVDALGKGNVTAAGCYVITPTVAPCPNFCPSTCAPSCQPSCCQTQVVTPPPPQPVYQPAHAPMPPPPAPAATVYQPTTVQWNQALQAPASPVMSQLMAWPGSQCSTSCSPRCAPTCSSLCCHYFNYKRKASIAAFLKKQRLQEEKH